MLSVALGPTVGVGRMCPRQVPVHRIASGTTVGEGEDYMTGELAFFELGVEDAERGRAFYEGLFGWTFEAGPSDGGYLITAPNVQGGMHSGDAGAVPYVFFAVDDMEAALQRVRDLGGSVEDVDMEGDAESVGRFGRFRLCRDDQGSPFGLHEAPKDS